MATNIACHPAFGALSRIARALHSLATPTELRRLMHHQHQFFLSIAGDIAARMPGRPDIPLVWPADQLRAVLAIVDLAYGP